MKERSVLFIAIIITLALWGYSLILADNERELFEMDSRNTSFTHQSQQASDFYPVRIVSLAPNITEILRWARSSAS